jgi:hypothetical protein
VGRNFRLDRNFLHGACRIDAGQTRRHLLAVHGHSKESLRQWVARETHSKVAWVQSEMNLFSGEDRIIITASVTGN